MRRAEKNEPNKYLIYFCMNYKFNSPCSCLRRNDKYGGRNDKREKQDNRVGWGNKKIPQLGDVRIFAIFIQPRLMQFRCLLKMLEFFHTCHRCMFLRLLMLYLPWSLHRLQPQPRRHPWHLRRMLCLVLPQMQVMLKLIKMSIKLRLSSCFSLCTLLLYQKS